MVIKSFFEFISKLDDRYENLDISLNVQGASLNVSTTFEVQIIGSDFFEHNLLDDFFSCQNLKFYIESINPLSKSKFLEKIKSDPEDSFNVSIIFVQDFLKNLQNPSVHFFDKKSVNKFLTLLSKNYHLKHFEKMNNKVNLQCNGLVIENFSSTLLTLNSDSVCAIDENTLNFFKLFHNKDVPIFVIPGSFPEFDINGMNYNMIIQGQLSQLANNNSSSDFRFIGKNTLTFTTDLMPDEKSIQKFMMGQLEETLKYIFDDPKTIDQKLTFYRKVLIDKLSKDTIISFSELDQEYFEDNLHEAQVVFDAFQDGEISTFIKEKKEIIKEYMSISQEVLRSINHLKNNLLRNLIALMVLFISNLALKSKGVTDLNDYRMILSAAIVFIMIIIFIHFINDNPIKENIENRRSIFNLHFKFLSSKSKSVKDAIETAMNKEVATLNNVLHFSITLYFTFAGLLLFLLSASHSHKHVLIVLDALKKIFLNSESWNL